MSKTQKYMKQKNNNSNKKLNYQIKTKSVLTQHLFGYNSKDRTKEFPCVHIIHTNKRQLITIIL